MRERVASVAWIVAALLAVAGESSALTLCKTPDGGVYAGDAPPQHCVPMASDDSTTRGKRPANSHEAGVGLWECDPGYVVATSSAGNVCVAESSVPKGPTMEIAPPSAWCVGCGVKKKGSKDDGSSEDPDVMRKRCAEEFPEDFVRQLSCVRGGKDPAGQADAFAKSRERIVEKCAAEFPGDSPRQARCRTLQNEALQELGP